MDYRKFELYEIFYLAGIIIQTHYGYCAPTNMTTDSLQIDTTLESQLEEINTIVKPTNPPPQTIFGLPLTIAIPIITAVGIPIVFLICCAGVACVRSIKAKTCGPKQEPVAFTPTNNFTNPNMNGNGVNGFKQNGSKPSAAFEEVNGYTREHQPNSTVEMNKTREYNTSRNKAIERLPDDESEDERNIPRKSGISHNRKRNDSFEEANTSVSNHKSRNNRKRRSSEDDSDNLKPIKASQNRKASRTKVESELDVTKNITKKSRKKSINEPEEINENENKEKHHHSRRARRRSRSRSQNRNLKEGETDNEGIEKKDKFNADGTKKKKRRKVDEKSRQQLEELARSPARAPVPVGLFEVADAEDNPPEKSHNKRGKQSGKSKRSKRNVDLPDSPPKMRMRQDSDDFGEDDC